ncbi:AAA domain-containing protein [Actinomycetospora cinnamomea]|uniref:AAA domain-containing protein n=1 Tax=Actinomycetospora cinnamomea TaxID=663609 RepID=A0A2U1E7M0_9PSEU|nr:AAA domain-containing protein [Actinomycetospora cinnamomea]PVY95895.1 AAA domain-containing protein [Actinomycetospora cinnamomea]
MKDRAIRLFEFLKQAQRLKSRAVASVETYRRSGDVVWWHELPAHPAVSTALGDAAGEGPVLRVDRVKHRVPPAAPGSVAAFVEGGFDDPADEPRLRRESAGDHPDGRAGEADAPPAQVVAEFERWLDDWREWAARESRDREARELYTRLFAIYLAATGHPEQKELLLARGCLCWRGDGQAPVQRHVLTSPLQITLDGSSGALVVEPAGAGDAISIELDMLDPSLIAHPQAVPALREEARHATEHVLDRDVVGGLARRLVYALSSEADYQDLDEPAVPGPRPVVSYAPALILRDRSQQGLVDIFSTIVDQMSVDGQVPDGLRPLVDPDHQPPPPDIAAGPANEGGAVVTVDDELFLPMPVNETQRRILRQVDTHAQTLVQGPPGTGKTHTAAALISHLLAQGLRVLVTAHTDRALREIRSKLPPDIQPLAVSVVGTAGEDMAQLRVAVERLAEQAAEDQYTDPHAVDEAVRRTLGAIDDLRRQRARAYRELIALREREVHLHEIAGYQGTLAGIAQQLATEEDVFGWLAEHVDTVTGDPALTDADAVAWHRLRTDPDVAMDEPEATGRFPVPESLPEPGQFATMVDAEASAATQVDQFAPLRAHPAWAGLGRLAPGERQALRSRMAWLASEADALDHRGEPWTAAALNDVRHGRGGPWHARFQQLNDLIAAAEPPVAALGSITDVRVTDGDVDALVPLAEALQAHLAGGGRIKLGPAGDPRSGAFAPRPVKQAAVLFERARVDGLAPTRPEQLEAFLAWVRATRTLAALDRAWPAGTDIPPEDTLHEQLQWHQNERHLLARILNLGHAYRQEERQHLERGLPRPDWRDPSLPRTYVHLVDAVTAADTLATTSRPLEELERQFDTYLAEQPDQAPACVTAGRQAVEARDRVGYAAAYRRLQRLHDVRHQVGRRDGLDQRLREHAPTLHAAITGSLNDPAWPERLSRFSSAWRWATARGWLTNQERQDVNALQARVSDIETDIRAQVEELAATRAWSHAVHPQRLSRGARASLQQYAYLVRRLGKGTGTYQAQRRAEIREAMDRCRAAVPVWILPLYRVADQLRISRDMFDVVIVDEASQAGLEATFLQYLAPRILVIGDDKQVSPSAVGVDQQQLRHLADQYLYDDPYRATWQDPQRSLFDEAKMRYGGTLTLTEHRRCVPEIIGFSNRIAYEPNNIRLVSVRQYGADRLDPIKTVFLPDGYTRGTTNKINPVEVDAVVEQIEACLADSRYDGLTIGAISLLGSAQAKAIEKTLLDRIPGDTWAQRDLRVGDAADFQGSERDVMFLSMVAAPEPGRRLTALTRESYVQRYNVAASRARDQMWVFHSVSLNDLTNTEDMRFHLLDYCHGIQHRSTNPVDGVPAGAVPDDERVTPFDSLFEQRVFNKLVDRGYTVIPQYPALGYRLDLVVVGGAARLAIECDGDTWHGPEAYQRDMARQRELERCGWHFFRIRESAFYVDPAHALSDLWDSLAELNIHPSTQQPDSAAQIDDVVPVAGNAPPTAGHDSPVAPEPEHSGAQPNNPPTDAPAPGPEPLREKTSQEPSSAVAHEPTTIDFDPAENGLAPYKAFTGHATPPAAATRAELTDGLLRIVEVEGPVLTDRAFAVYVRAAGGRRVGPQIAKDLATVVKSAVRRGQLVQDNPLDESAQQRTLRLPSQPVAIPRELGPRSFDDIPPRELAHLIYRVQQDGLEDEQQLFREVLNRYGLKRLTPNVTARLKAARSINHTNAESHLVRGRPNGEASLARHAAADDDCGGLAEPPAGVRVTAGPSGRRAPLAPAGMTSEGAEGDGRDAPHR